MSRAPVDAPVLTIRELNRATLARQLLLQRVKLDAVTAIERIAALQAQWSPSPYVALWTRLLGFRREELWSALEAHRIVRARLMRGTHVTASSWPICSAPSEIGGQFHRC